MEPEHPDPVADPRGCPLPAYVPVFVVAVVFMVVVIVVGRIVAALAGRPDGRDERDRQIGWRAESNSGWLVATGVLTGRRPRRAARI